MDIVRWLHSKLGAALAADAIGKAAQDGHLNERGAMLSRKGLRRLRRFDDDRSADHGQVELVKWLHHRTNDHHGVDGNAVRRAPLAAATSLSSNGYTTAVWGAVLTKLWATRPWSGG